MTRRLLSVIGGLLLSACSTAQPVLYPNAHLQSAEKDLAKQDIEVCRQLAETAGAEKGSGKAERVATGTAVGAGVGAASGAVWGLLMGLFSASGSSQPNQAYTNFVNRCLQEKGYEVTGWQ
jgi:hypothetical protein